MVGKFFNGSWRTHVEGQLGAPARPGEGGRPDLEAVAARDEDDGAGLHVLARRVPRGLEGLGVVGDAVARCPEGSHVVNRRHRGRRRRRSRRRRRRERNRSSRRSRATAVGGRLVRRPMRCCCCGGGGGRRRQSNALFYVLGTEPVVSSSMDVAETEDQDEKVEQSWEWLHLEDAAQVVERERDESPDYL